MQKNDSIKYPKWWTKNDEFYFGTLLEIKGAEAVIQLEHLSRPVTVRLSTLQPHATSNPTTSNNS